MKEFTTEKIHTICLTGSRGAGKTSLADAIAYYAGLNTRIGKVDEGTSLFDYQEAEISHRTTLSSKLCAMTYRDYKLNIIDTPGHPDFCGELLEAARVSEAVGIVIDATAGAQVSTQLQWRLLEQENVAHFFFVNKMTKENVSWEKNLQSLKDAFGKQAVAVVIPIGEAAAFKGVVDLLHLKAFSFDDKGNSTEIPIPADMKDEVDRERALLVEVAAEASDEFMEKYFAEGTLSEQEVHDGLAIGIRRGTLYPVLFGSAVHGVGIRSMLDFMLEYLPSANELPARKARKVGTQNDIDLIPDPNGKPVAFVFKTVSEGHQGEMSYFKAMNGTIKPGMDLINQANGTVERIGHLYTFQSKNRIDLNSVAAGDLGVMVKLKSTHTGNTLTDKELSVQLPPIPFPNPVMDVSIKPKTKGDEDKLATAFHKLHEEDPTFRLVHDGELHQMVLYGQGATHIEILVEKLKKRFGIDVEIGKPRVPYRETIRSKAEKQYKHKKQSGGRGQYGDVHLRIEPLSRGDGFQFEDAITGGVIPNKYIPAIEKGVAEALHAGSLAGAKVVDVKATVFYGSYHDVDSSDMAFKIAGLMAFREAFMEAKPVLLEPIYNVEILVPDDYTGDVMGDLSSRRGKIAGMEPNGRGQIIKASVPQAELFRYSVDLRSMTQGQGAYSLTFSHYEEVPREYAAKIIEEERKLNPVVHHEE